MAQEECPPVTIAIAHSEPARYDAEGRALPQGAILDLVREVSPPFGPEGVVAEFAAVLQSYDLSEATSDRCAGSWPTEAFRNVGITVRPSEKTRSDIYLATLPMIMSQQVGSRLNGVRDNEPQEIPRADRTGHLLSAPPLGACAVGLAIHGGNRAPAGCRPADGRGRSSDGRSALRWRQSRTESYSPRPGDFGSYC
jgi:hypothetical protein